MRIRRRRRDYTPEQEASRKALHRAEMWSQIVGDGIAESFKREHYCSDGGEMIIDFVTTEYAAAVHALKAANDDHDKAMGWSERRAQRVTVSARRNPKKKKTAA